MAQTLFKATGLTSNNTDDIKDAGMAVARVKWVNVNDENIVVTHEDDFVISSFVDAIKSADGSVSLSVS